MSNTEKSSKWSDLYKNEDWWAVWLGFVIILDAVVGLVGKVPMLGKWTDNPLDIFFVFKNGEVVGDLFIPLLLLFVGFGLVSSLGVKIMGGKALKYAAGYTAVFLFAICSYLFANQVQIKAYGLGYAFWALGIGLLISNTVGTPKCLMDV